MTQRWNPAGKWYEGIKILGDLPPLTRVHQLPAEKLPDGTLRVIVPEPPDCPICKAGFPRKPIKTS